MEQVKILMAVGTGSFIGGVFRYLLSRFIHMKILSAFPIGTFVVNVLGCFLIGAVIAFSEKGAFNPPWRMFLTTGLLGGFTTFSAFSNETVMLLKNGQLSHAIVYILVSVLVGLAATFLGMTIVKMT
jgi:CrcB protein